MEGWRKFESLIEKADPSKLDLKRFPIELDKVDVKAAQVTSRSGGADGSVEDDVIDVNVGASFSVSELKPSQSTMKISNSVTMAISMLAKLQGRDGMAIGGDLGGFISSDKHIMDGHHRWVATAMVDPSEKVVGYYVDFPATQLIAVLNNITKGRFQQMKGKAGSGSFADFNYAGILKQLQEYATNGIPGKYPRAAEDVLLTCEKFTGMEGQKAVIATAKKFAANVKQLQFQVPAAAPPRDQMPVIDGGDRAKEAAVALSLGQVDVNPPYASTSSSQKGRKNEKE
tara:strand:- start:3611 stop:4465 length:855 start_codon:yes stop_codon:yes gene_type:complete